MGSASCSKQIISAQYLSEGEKGRKAARVVASMPLEKFLPDARFDDYFRAAMKKNH